jgi:diphthamide synthase (EF-2-diphthine--ammonia ligase)
MLSRATVGQQVSAQRQTGSTKAIGQKAEVTDADEAFGQHMQKETTQELNQLDAEFVGREFDGDLLAALPAGIDPCGEKGEFHSFVYDGPMFDFEIPVVAGKRVVRDQFVFADLIRVSSHVGLSSERIK